MSEIAGVSEESVKGLCLEIQDYAECFQNLFNQIDQTLAEAKISFQGDVADAFFRKYNELKHSYNIVKKNMFSYIDDFQKAVAAYQNQDEINSTQIQSTILEVLDEKGDYNANNR